MIHYCPSVVRSASARRCRSALIVALLSTTCAISVASSASAQPAQTTDIELGELSVTGEGAGRSLGGSLYGPGGASGAVPGYVASRSTVATKTDTPIVETAQSISVIGRKQIEDQNALTINQALRYTPGVTTEQRGGAGSTRLEQFLIRGFNAPVFLDGMALIASRDANATIDPYRLERVDVIKGPASVLYGQSGPGGIVNLVSKVPQFVRHGEVFVQGGGFNEVRGGIDVGGPIQSEVPWLADQFAYRIVGAGWNGDGPVDTTRVDRALINPSVTWRPSTDTQLTIIGNYQRDPFSGFYGGFPAVGTVFPRNFGSGVIGRLPVNFYDGDRNIERSDRTQASIEYLFDHRFNENLRFHSAGRYLRTQGDYRSVYSAFSPRNGPFATGPLLPRAVIGNIVAAEAYTMDSNVVANFDTGPIAHTALLGVDHRTFSTRASGTPFPNAPDLNALAPNYEMNIPFPAINTTSRVDAQQTGVYFQDQMKVDGLILTLGGRYDVARQTGPTRSFTATGSTLTLQDAASDAFTGRASLLYLFQSGVAPYVSYSQAFEPIVAGRVFDTAFGTVGRVPDPQLSDQYEAGIKYQPPGTDILLTAAFFDIRQSNRTTADTTLGRPTGFVLQTGEVGVQGVEFEARANLTEGVTLIGGFSLLDIRNVRDDGRTANDLAPGQTVPLQGRRPVLVPDSTASLLATYRFLDGPMLGLEVGGGVRYLGPSWGDAANTFKVPESMLVDAVVSYDLKNLDPTLAGFSMQLNANNLLDDTYVSGCNGYTSCYYGLPRTVYATLRYRW
ncbi:TonB-dependent siderophore receptor [Methylobacterium sp. WL30]|uniref:TonB-dependent siderophore receptor n=1 Tax=unclassified Methylobacterium TaxID=2615210 RepID=UPI0011CCBDE0|nr:MULTISPECIES: TonB-dependent siderophore receptor [unclassified Methylobacterium]TXN39860.1 TonB-dependent siderophore receptor [Methylobacterium sp. WL93]TXN51668.1 TonB-dependent siderophore receptor [Methylobacterium sp. WL119]TXN68409.1 TonB-dependent siderophore receptor [Methylobacterium sp. WL30]